MSGYSLFGERVALVDVCVVAASQDSRVVVPYDAHLISQRLSDLRQPASRHRWRALRRALCTSDRMSEALRGLVAGAWSGFDRFLPRQALRRATGPRSPLRILPAIAAN